jgi:FAD synthase
VQAFFVRRVRDEMRFPSGWELSQQIARDVVATTAALREETAPRSVLGG